MKEILAILKPYFKGIVLGLTLFFIANVLQNHWQKVIEVRLDSQGWLLLLCALGINILAHIWSGWVWLGILGFFQQSVEIKWGMRIYLITNIYKYLPGNLGHLYGRIMAILKRGVALEIASISVLLEPILMATAALLIALLGHFIGWIKTDHYSISLQIQILGLTIILLAIHPRILNPILNWLNRLKNKQQYQSITLKKYPLVPLLGELGFLGLRSTGFILTWLAFANLNFSQIPSLVSGFSFAWLLGLIIPGAPGGVGLFEATMIALLNHQIFPLNILLVTLALFRIISIVAEVIGAGIAQLIKVY